MESAARGLVPFSHFEQLREARSIITQEAEALRDLAGRLDADFCAAVTLLSECAGHVVVTGVGKAGLIGQKVAATLSSTGTPARFLHPVEAVHGDLGCLAADDVVLVLSNSGETEEVCRLLPLIRRLGASIAAVTADERSTLGAEADVILRLGRFREAGPHGLAPSTTTTAMLALGDALALVVSRIKGFTPQQFAVFHPGGSLGRRLSAVRQVMRKSDQIRIAAETETIREVFVNLSRPGRRTGAVILVDGDGRLSGLFTDSDLARLLERGREFQLDRPIAEFMTRDPVTVQADALLSDAVERLSARKLSELPVVDGDGKPVGLIDITDVIGLMPADEG